MRNVKRWYKENGRGNSLSILKNLTNILSLNISQTGINQAINHPHYPNYLSLIETLHEWKIPALSIKVNPFQISELPIPFIAHLNNEFIIVTANGKEVEYLDTKTGWVTLTSDKFTNIWDGNGIIIERNEKSGESDYEKKRREEILQKTENYFALGVGTFISILGIWLSNSLLNGSAFLALLIGLVICIFLIQNEFGKSNEIIVQFCKLNKQTDCNAVLKSPASKFFGWLSWSEIGLFYFTGSLLSCLMAFLVGKTAIILPVLLIFNGLALPYTVFSVYYQAFIAKKWCVLCLVVQIVLWINFVLLSSYFKYLQIPDFQSVSIVLLSFLLPIMVWFIFKPHLIKAEKLPEAQKEAARYYRNSELFTTFLENQKSIQCGQLPNEIILGNPQANLEILIVCSAFCNPCARAHKELEDLVDYHAEEMKIIVRFAVDNNLDTERNKVTKHILSLNPAIQAQALKDWFTTMDYTEWSSQYPVKLLQSIKELLTQHNNWCEYAQITHTPTIFINGKKLKEPYSYKHLRYHLRSLIETSVYT
jgi:uncharacterized membrane protein